MTNKIKLAEFVPPTEDEERERQAEVKAIREAQKQAQAEEAAQARSERSESPEEDFMRSLTDEQRERMPRLQADAKKLADMGDIEGAKRKKRMFDSKYTKTVERPDGTKWDYVQVTPWTIEDCVAQIIEPMEDGKPPTMAEQIRRFRYCSERRVNKDGIPYGPPRRTDPNMMVWQQSREWYEKLEYYPYYGGRMGWRAKPDDPNGLKLDLPYWREDSSAEQPEATPEGEGAVLNRFFNDNDAAHIAAETRLAFDLEIPQWGEDRTIAFLLGQVSVNTTDPMLEYIKRLEWDGVVRIPTMISNYDHTKFSGVWSESLVYTFVKRLIDPGKKADTVFTLQGGQGLWKTSFFKAITAGILLTPEFSALPTESKDELMRTQGGCVLLLDEIDKLVENGRGSTTHIGQLKTFISATRDEFRAPYARASESHQRRYILCATTNSTNWISDLEGYRRWAVLPLEKPIPEELRPNGDRSYWDQLLAEAYYRYTVEGYGGPEYEDLERLAEATTLSQLDDPVYDSISDWLERPAADRTMMTTSAGANGVTAHNDVVNIACLDIRLIRDAIPDLERRKISGSFKQQVTGAMDRMPGFVRVELEKNSNGQYKKKRRVINGKSKPIHTAWDLLATVQAYDAADNPLGEPIECLASDIPSTSAEPSPNPNGWNTRVDANDNLVADRTFNAGLFPAGFLPTGAVYARADFPYDVPLTSASVLKTIN